MMIDVAKKKTFFFFFADSLLPMLHSQSDRGRSSARQIFLPSAACLKMLFLIVL